MSMHGIVILWCSSHPSGSIFEGRSCDSLALSLEIGEESLRVMVERTVAHPAPLETVSSPVRALKHVQSSEQMRVAQKTTPVLYLKSGRHDI